MKQKKSLLIILITLITSLTVFIIFPKTIMAGDNICKWMVGSCEPAESCPPGEVHSQEYSNLCHQGTSFDTCINISGGNLTGPLCVINGGGFCSWKGASSCEPVKPCPPGEVHSQEYSNLCHQGTSFDTCINISGENLTGPLCVTVEEYLEHNSPICSTKEGGKGINTAIGCIPINETDFIAFILKWAIGLGGGIAFLLIILASFQIMTSRGDPKRLEAGKELLSSAIMGLILLIFSVTILKIIGVDILQISGF